MKKITIKKKLMDDFFLLQRLEKKIIISRHLFLYMCFYYQIVLSDEMEHLRNGENDKRDLYGESDED